MTLIRLMKCLSCARPHDPTDGTRCKHCGGSIVWDDDHDE